MAIIGYCFILGFINYASLFILNVIEHVGTVRLQGNTYQLANVAKYDDETVYYLGKCEKTVYKCKFHRIYNTILFSSDVPEMVLDENHQRLVIKINDLAVYTFDGLTEYCEDSDYGYCPSNLR